MGGGLMQLVAYGAQDVYLTGNPQITFFKVVYRRYTNFAMEVIELVLSNNPDFGKKANVTVLRNGDLCGKMALEVHLNAVSLSIRNEQTDRLRVAWIKRLGLALIRWVEVEIGGSRIDKQYGVWLDIWYELTHHFDQERGYKNMIGDVPELTRLHPVTSVLEQQIIPEYTIFVPLQFWFNRNTGLSLPLIALQYHEVRMYFEFVDVHELVIWTGNMAPDYTKFSMREASLLVDYIYLDSEERRRFAQVGHEYLIEQVQFTGAETLNDGGDATRINGKFKLNFNHPTKELYWALRVGAFNGANAKNLNGNRGRFLTYTNGEEYSWETEALDYAADNIARGMITCTEPTNDEIHYETIVLPACDNDTVCPKFPCTYTYCSTTLKDLTVTFHYPAMEASTLTIYLITNPLVENVGAGNLYNMGDFIHKFDINLICDPEITVLLGFDVDVQRQSLNLNDVSIEIDDWTDYRSTTDQSTGLNKYDVSVVQLNNYGVRLDGRGNPMRFGKIQLNGHDRLDDQEGMYYNYYQPYNHHTHTPSDGINVYSFAIHPEQHQPSGTCNLSRIDSTLLLVRFQDPFRAQRNVPQLNLARDSNFYVFAYSYNVLRVMSGMAGLAYSN